MSKALDGKNREMPIGRVDLLSIMACKISFQTYLREIMGILIFDCICVYSSFSVFLLFKCATNPIVQNLHRVAREVIMDLSMPPKPY